MADHRHNVDSSSDVRRSPTQGYLKLSSVPAGAEALLGKYLRESPLSIAGDYICDIPTHDFTVLEGIVKPLTIVGTVTPALERYFNDRVTVRDAAAGAVNLASNTQQVLSFSALNGAQRCRLRITVAGGGSVSGWSVAEYNGL